MKRNSTPIYMQVAIDVAARISRNELKKDSKISGRTTLASEYNVSPETIRKAMRLLSDMNIVEVKHGNGIYVSSVNRAEEFIERYRTRESINKLKEKMIQLMKEREVIEEQMNNTMTSIIDYTSRFKNSDHITIYEELITKESNAVNKSLETLNIWPNTGATIVAIKREGLTLISPAPYEIIHEMDKLLFVGEPNSSIRLREYLREIN